MERIEIQACRGGAATPDAARLPVLAACAPLLALAVAGSKCQERGSEDRGARKRSSKHDDGDCARVRNDGGTLSTSTELVLKRRLSDAEDERLRTVRRALRDGMITSDVEEAAISAVGGDHAGVYGEITPRGFSTLAAAMDLAD